MVQRFNGTADPLFGPRRGDDAGDEHRNVIRGNRGHGRRGFVKKGRSGGDLGEN